MMAISPHPPQKKARHDKRLVAPSDGLALPHHLVACKTQCTNELEEYAFFKHMKRVNTSGLNISDKHSSIDFLRDLPDQVWREEPSKIDHSSVQHDPHGIKLEDREFRIFVEKRLATNSIGRYEMLQILTVSYSTVTR